MDFNWQEALHPRGYHGRWILSVGDRVHNPRGKGAHGRVLQIGVNGDPNKVRVETMSGVRRIWSIQNIRKLGSGTAPQTGVGGWGVGARVPKLGPPLRYAHANAINAVPNAKLIARIGVAPAKLGGEMVPHYLVEDAAGKRYHVADGRILGEGSDRAERDPSGAARTAGGQLPTPKAPGAAERLGIQAPKVPGASAMPFVSPPDHMWKVLPRYAALRHAAEKLGIKGNLQSQHAPGDGHYFVKSDQGVYHVKYWSIGGQAVGKIDILGFNPATAPQSAPGKLGPTFMPSLEKDRWYPIQSGEFRRAAVAAGIVDPHSYGLGKAFGEFYIRGSNGEFKVEWKSINGPVKIVGHNKLPPNPPASQQPNVVVSPGGKWVKPRGHFARVLRDRGLPPWAVYQPGAGKPGHRNYVIQFAGKYHNAVVAGGKLYLEGDQGYQANRVPEPGGAPPAPPAPQSAGQTAAPGPFAVQALGAWSPIDANSPFAKLGRKAGIVNPKQYALAHMSGLGLGYEYIIRADNGEWHVRYDGAQFTVLGHNPPPSQHALAEPFSIAEANHVWKTLNPDTPLYQEAEKNGMPGPFEYQNDAGVGSVYYLRGAGGTYKVKMALAGLTILGHNPPGGGVVIPVSTPPDKANARPIGPIKAADLKAAGIPEPDLFMRMKTGGLVNSRIDQWVWAKNGDAYHVEREGFGKWKIIGLGAYNKGPGEENKVTPPVASPARLAPAFAEQSGAVYKPLRNGMFATRAAEAGIMNPAKYAVYGADRNKLQYYVQGDNGKFLVEYKDGKVLLEGHNPIAGAPADAAGAGAPAQAMKRALAKLPGKQLMGPRGLILKPNTPVGKALGIQSNFLFQRGIAVQVDGVRYRHYRIQYGGAEHDFLYRGLNPNLPGEVHFAGPVPPGLLKPGAAPAAAGSLHDHLNEPEIAKIFDQVRGTQLGHWGVLPKSAMLAQAMSLQEDGKYQKGADYVINGVSYTHYRIEADGKTQDVLFGMGGLYRDGAVPGGWQNRREAFPLTPVPAGPQAPTLNTPVPPGLETRAGDMGGQSMPVAPDWMKGELTLEGVRRGAATGGQKGTIGNREVFVKPTQGRQGIRANIPYKGEGAREVAVTIVAKYLGVRMARVGMVPSPPGLPLGTTNVVVQDWIPDSTPYRRLNTPTISYQDAIRAAVFDAVIANTDRHTDNIKVTPDGKTWMIDHGLVMPTGSTEGQGAFIDELHGKAIPADLTTALAHMVADQDVITKEMRALGVEQKAIDLMWKRVSLMLSTRKVPNHSDIGIRRFNKWHVKIGPQ